MRVTASMSKVDGMYQTVSVLYHSIMTLASIKSLWKATAFSGVRWLLVRSRRFYLRRMMMMTMRGMLT